MNFEEMATYFESDEVKASIEEFLKELEQEDLKKIEFEAKEQDEVMKKICAALIEKQMVDIDDLMYNPEHFNFTEEEFLYTFENLDLYASSNELVSTDPSNYFPNEQFYINYENVKIVLHTMVGQGTVTWMSICPELEWREEISFDYQHYRRQLINKLLNKYQSMLNFKNADHRGNSKFVSQYIKRKEKKSEDWVSESIWFLYEAIDLHNKTFGKVRG